MTAGRQIRTFEMILRFGPLFLACCASLSAAQELLVSVEQGVLRGSVAVSALGQPYAAFRGVPYARPPLHELRFQAPQPAPRWEGVRDALEESLACAQLPANEWNSWGPVSEDCLYLNVYAPLDASAAAPAPVLLFIHGGGFMLGSGTSRAYGPDLFIQQGVAVVTFNYRLGALGYLSTEDDVIPGNAGMKDQVLAMQWVQRNIAAFGGDPARVTVGGVSAGGSSVSHHLLSPASAGLFSRVIIESGEAAAPFGIVQNPRERAFRLGEALGFSTNDSQQLLDFLRTQNATDLVSHDEQLFSEEEARGISTLAWAPVVERGSSGAFLAELPADSLKAGRFNRVDVLDGVNSADGVAFLMDPVGKEFLDDPDLLRQLNDNFVQIVAPGLHLPTAGQREEAALQLRRFYFGSGDITPDSAQALVDMETDMFFAEPADSSLRLLANSSDDVTLYYYLFDYRGPGLANTTFGSWHNDESVVMFVQRGEPAPDPNTEFGQMTYNLVRLWSNFITYGTPSPEGEPIVWLPFTNTDLNYLHITEVFEMQQNMNKERMDFWHQNIPL